MWPPRGTPTLSLSLSLHLTLSLTLTPTLARYANPYSAEIGDFSPSEAQLLPGPERLPWPLHQTPCMWVATELALQQVAQ